MAYNKQIRRRKKKAKKIEAERLYIVNIMLLFKNGGLILPAPYMVQYGCNKMKNSATFPLYTFEPC